LILPLPLVKKSVVSTLKTPPTNTQIDSLDQLVDYQQISIENEQLIRQKKTLVLTLTPLPIYSVDAVAEFWSRKN
jgi:hypothetical protein